MWRRALAASAAALAILGSGVPVGRAAARAPIAPPSTSSGPADPVLVGAGDISTCANVGRHEDGRPDRGHPRHGVHRRRQRLPVGRARRLRGLLRADVGRVPGPHPPEPRQPRLRDRSMRLGYFAYFGSAAGDPERGLLRLRPRRVADLRPQLELCAGRWLRRGLTTAAVAEGGPRREPAPLRPRVLASPALQLRRPRQLRRRSRVLDGRCTRPAPT